MTGCGPAPIERQLEDVAPTLVAAEEGLGAAVANQSAAQPNAVGDVAWRTDDPSPMSDSLVSGPAGIGLRPRDRLPPMPLAAFEEHYRAGRFDDALSVLRDVLRQRPDDPEVLYWMAVTQRDAGRPHRAEPALNRLLQIDPQQTQARKLLCAILHEDGRSEAATAQMDAVIAAGNADAEVFLLRASARLNCRDWSAAERDAGVALSLDPALWQALLVRSAARARRGEAAAARADLEAARAAGAPDRQCDVLETQLSTAAGTSGP